MEDIQKDGKQKTGLNKSALVSIAFELGFIIALPVLVFGFLGKWLDQKAGTYPILTLVGILGAITMTSIWIYRKFRVYVQK
jgi:hypothetical protein